MRIESATIQATGGKHPSSTTRPTSPATGFDAQLQHQIHRTETQGNPGSTASSGREGTASGLVHIGTISRENPTVSHLLISHADHGRDCWDIVHSDANAQKAFRRLREGEEIYLDPSTREVVWGRESHFPQDKAAPEAAASSGSPSAAGDDVASREAPSPQKAHETAAAGDCADAASTACLATVLKQHIGTPYERLDCYELVVAGLREMGVRYAGPGGMQRYLINAAASQGLPMNAYLTGNGLIEASAATVYDRTLSTGSRAGNGMEQVWQEIEPSLEKGLIVSFSTGDRGHTGVVSRYGRTWTFLNSGDIDNDVRSGTRRKGVGEEDLRSEIENWFRRAARKGKPLRIALGRLNPDKLAAFGGASSSRRTA
ncbi:MAG: hypothetical protein ACLFUL_13685 [Desulfobacteraceae bacterium]